MGNCPAKCKTFLYGANSSSEVQIKRGVEQKRSPAGLKVYLL